MSLAEGSFVNTTVCFFLLPVSFDPSSTAGAAAVAYRARLVRGLFARPAGVAQGLQELLLAL